MHLHFVNDNQKHIGKKTVYGWPSSGRLYWGKFCFSYSLFASFCDVGFDISDEDLTMKIGIPYIVSLWLSTELIRGQGHKELSLKIHDWSIWWNLWTSSMEWSSQTPRWRNGCFHILDFLFGKNKYVREIIEERDVQIPMPEGNYDAHIKFCKDVWKRSRGFSKTILRIDADIPKGIPHAGKGENSWDCGDDATFGMCCTANSIVEGVGEIVKSCLKTRVRCGGWRDYKWERKV